MSNASWEQIELITGWRPRRNRALTYGDLALLTDMSPNELMALPKDKLRRIIAGVRRGKS